MNRPLPEDNIAFLDNSLSTPISAGGYTGAFRIHVLTGYYEHAQTVGMLRSQIVPYFSITHAVRGQVPGPYTKLPPASPVRRLALDVAVLIGDDPSLSSAVNVAVLGTKEEPYWHNISTTNRLPASCVGGST